MIVILFTSSSSSGVDTFGMPTGSSTVLGVSMTATDDETGTGGSTTLGETSPTFGKGSHRFYKKKLVKRIFHCMVRLTGIFETQVLTVTSKYDDSGQFIFPTGLSNPLRHT